MEELLEKAVEDQCKGTAFQIMALAHVDRWADWIVFQLSRMESIVTARSGEAGERREAIDFERILRQVHDGIDARLERGQW